MEEVNYNFDLAILSLSDANQLILDNQNLDKQILERTKVNFQKFYNQLMTIKQDKELQRDNIDDDNKVYDYEKSAFDIILPKQKTIFPRHKPIPKSDKQLTRWQTFAKEKGIQKKKRSRLVYDEVTGEYAPRWGSKSVKKNQENAEYIMEVKQGQDPYVDPFKKKSLEKQLSKAKQQLYEENNVKVQKGIDLGKKRQLKKDKSEKKVKNEFKYNTKAKLSNEKQNVNKKLSIAQQSTQSQGRFDKLNKNESEIKQKKIKKIPQFKNNSDERNRNLSILDSISKKVKQ